MSVIYQSDQQAVSAMRDYFALGASNLINTANLSDALVLSMIDAAESDLSRKLRTYLQVTKIIPNDVAQSEIDALNAAGTPYAFESAYDYDPDFFKGNRWGFIVTRERPIHSVESITFAYPAPTDQVWQVPSDWIRMDEKYGQIRLVPATNSFSAPLTAFVMQALGGGYQVPFMIRLRYFAGIGNESQHWPDLVDLVKRMAVFRMMKGASLPGSSSISADGLSESNSITLTDWQGQIEKDIDTLRDAILGPRMSALGVG